jgi:transcriptional regulator with XRE-family HTH domain
MPAMKSGNLIREARRRAGLTQRELAARAGTTQPVIARIESGRSTPSLERLVRLVRACGFDLDIRVVPLDEDAWTLAEQGRHMTPDQRLDRLLAGVELLEAGHEARGERR